MFIMGQVTESWQYKIMDSEVKLLLVFSEWFSQLFPLLHHGLVPGGLADGTDPRVSLGHPGKLDWKH